jgi:HTH-type transcriptional regulator/antitoxin HigA
MAIQPIHTEVDYDRALARLQEIFQSPAGTMESNEADVLATLIESYEGRNHPIDLPDPITAIRIRMDEQGLSQRDLVQTIGSKSRVSEVLNRRRPLTVRMVHALSSQLGLSAETLVQPYELRPYARLKQVLPVE